MFGLLLLLILPSCIQSEYNYRMSTASQVLQELQISNEDVNFTNICGILIPSASFLEQPETILGLVYMRDITCTETENNIDCEWKKNDEKANGNDTFYELIDEETEEFFVTYVNPNEITDFDEKVQQEILVRTILGLNPESGQLIAVKQKHKEYFRLDENDDFFEDLERISNIETYSESELSYVDKLNTFELSITIYQNVEEELEESVQINDQNYVVEATGLRQIFKPCVQPFQ